MELYFYMCSKFQGKSVITDLVKLLQENGLVLTMKRGQTLDGKLGPVPYAGDVFSFVEHAYRDDQFTNPVDLEFCGGPRFRIETITRLKYPEPDIPRRDYICLTCGGLMLGPNYNYVSTLLSFGTTPEAPETDSPFFEDGAQFTSHLGMKLFEYLEPMYGWLEYPTCDFLSRAAIRDRKELNTFYWGNYFGKEYIDKYGADFFLDSPCWRKEVLSNGSIYLQTSEFYTRPLDGKEKTRLQKYLSPQGIIVYEDNPFSATQTAA
jgi:hypothetical protein